MSYTQISKLNQTVLYPRGLTGGHLPGKTYKLFRADPSWIAGTAIWIENTELKTSPILQTSQGNQQTSIKSGQLIVLWFSEWDDY